jgi:hypothetical protein
VTLTLEHGEGASPDKERKLAHPSRRMYTVTALCRLTSRVMERTWSGHTLAQGVLWRRAPARLGMR